jgi:predicted RNA methylase
MAEMHLRMHQLEQAGETIYTALRLKQELPLELKFHGMKLEAYVSAVLAQIEMALGR